MERQIAEMNSKAKSKKKKKEGKKKKEIEWNWEIFSSGWDLIQIWILFYHRVGS